MNKVFKITFGVLLILIGIGLTIFAIMIWPRPFIFAMFLIGFIPVFTIGIGTMFIGFGVIQGMSMKEIISYIELLWR
jgi:hypothetical protein